MAELCPFEVVPTKITASPNRPTPVSLNYTNQDFWSLKNRLVQYCRENFDQQFNDFIESSLAIMLIENWAFIGDTLSFKTDQVANEVFIDTVTELDSAFRLAKLVGYQPTPPIAGKSLWSAKINTPQDINLIIPTPLEIDLVNNNIPLTIELFPADQYERPLLDQPIIIQAGNLQNTNIVGLEGQTYTQSFVGTGEINQVVVLEFAPVLLGSIRVYVDAQQWKQVQFFTESAPLQEYRIEYNSQYQVFVYFGNNRAGLVPPAGANITVVYRVGGGTIGNIVSNFVNTDILIPLEGRAYSVPVNFSNYTRGKYGYDGDTIEDIRRNLPAWTNVQNRAVTGSDYKNLVDIFTTAYNGKTGKGMATLRHSGCSANLIILYVLVSEGLDGLAPPSSQFKAELQEYIDAKKMLTDSVAIQDGGVLYTQINIDVVMSPQYQPFEEEVTAAILRNLAVFFNVKNWDYGQALRTIDVLKALANISQPYKYDIQFVVEPENLTSPLLPNNPNLTNPVEVVPRFFEIIRPSNIVLNYIYE
jgi:hypothetical protein